MSLVVRATDREQDLIGSIVAAVADRLADVPEVRWGEFARQYHHWVPTQDLADRAVDDLAGAVVAHWRTARDRPTGEAKVRVYDPTPGTAGWTSPYTVIEIVSDDMPFLVDSVTMELGRQGYAIELIVHPVMRVLRDRDGELERVLAPGENADGAVTESVIHAEVTHESDPDRLSVLQSGIELVLEEVRVAVQDWGAMRAQLTVATDELAHRSRCGAHELAEARAFLAWLADDHLTFLGYREYELRDEGDAATVHVVEGTGLGILRGVSPRPVTPLSPRAMQEARSAHPLVLAKANSRSTVHRPAYLDYIGVKRFDADGRVTGERRFLGLYTTSAYKAPPHEIPLLRDKVALVTDRAGLPPDSHDAKGLTDILESFPRDLLVQIDPDDLFEIAIGVLGLGERQRVRLFVSADRLDRFVACILCLPRDRFTTVNRRRAERILLAAFHGDQIDGQMLRTELRNVRVDYIVHCPDGVPEDYDAAAIEAEIVRATRAWADDLRAALLAERGEAAGVALLARYAQAFPGGYRADVDAATAVADIGRMERLHALGREPGTQIALYRRRGDTEQTIRAKLLSTVAVSLSEVVPKFEHMGAMVVSERPYEIVPDGAAPVWIYDFELRCDPAGLDRAGDRFGSAFLGVWSGELEDDRLNGLVMGAGLSGREVTIIRAVLRYLRQAQVPFSDAYMIQTLLDNPEIVRRTVELFAARFDPEIRDRELAERLTGELREAIDAVQSLDADRILRRVVAVVEATLRTNYYRRPTRPSGPDAIPPCLSFKLDPGRLEFLPRPRPRYEIFVYSPRVEGVHLRGGHVARGGLRWSDRREDFRTEVLGLMKAQMVKNALIVPVGAKGGFVVKCPPARDDRESQMAEGIACYRSFLGGLLDLTDNYVDDRVAGPERVVAYDDDDPYLVVAADKGTAAFSDIANEVGAGYGFWLGDAFASGGSRGYDHKQMGITARGAWVSVARHFGELGLDVATEDFTVAGIGDMSGDVFGNGMLRSEHIRLVAAFNHAHVFLDPDPDPRRSFAERERLFALPRSGWDDYDRAVISTGGGVHSRAAKSIAITPEVGAALAITATELAPDELISAVLRAPVDLLFNGGIGTYVKARDESHRAAGDRANDAVRVDGDQLRCRVVAEGGNLGLTQRGRIEYALHGGPDDTGGQIYTDAIDNAAGVNCSDHEVNIKILLGQLTAAGQMTDEERNAALRRMTDAVAESVLAASDAQTQALSLAAQRATSMIDVYARMISELEATAGLDRELEGLPGEAEIAERRAEQLGLTAPELATIMAHGKIHLREALLASELPDDPDLAPDLIRYFPPPLPEQCAAEMRSHRLRRELIAAIVANELVDRAGITFVFRLHEETGATPAQLGRAYTAARDVFAMRDVWAQIRALDHAVEAGMQRSMLHEAERLVGRAARWLVRAGGPGAVDIAATVRRFAPGVNALAAELPGALRGEDRETFDARLQELSDAGVPPALARRVASMPSLLSVFDIVEDAALTGQPAPVVTAVYFGLGSRLGLDWLRDRILQLGGDDRWQALARSALRDDLYALHRALTREVLVGGAPRGGEAAIESWLAANADPLARAEGVLADVRVAREHDTTALPVALRELKNLVPDSPEAV